MPAILGLCEKSSLMWFASVIQFSIVISGLPTFTICSTFTSANCFISGTALTSSSPRIEPALYSVKLVEEAPLPAIVPPVERTHTSGNSLLSDACAQPNTGHVKPTSIDGKAAPLRALNGSLNLQMGACEL